MKNEAQDVLDSIRRLVQELRWADRKAESTLGLSGAQLFVMKRLAEKPGISVNELAERTCTHQSSVSVVVRRLVEKGLVKRRESRSDRRRAELSLTRQGQKLLTRSLKSPQDRIIEAINSMPVGDRKQLAMRLAEVLEAMGLLGTG
jgi:DNA-binding MarR family transcriptional regulator